MTNLVRYVDWVSRLMDVLNEHAQDEFEYGIHDCCKFAAMVVEAMTGVNFSKDFSYSGEDEATTLMEKHGGVGGIATKLLGKGGPRFRRGDIVMADIGEGDALGICVGPKLAFAAKPQGIVYIDRSAIEVKKAWMVG